MWLAEKQKTLKHFTKSTAVSCGTGEVVSGEHLSRKASDDAPEQLQRTPDVGSKPPGNAAAGSTGTSGQHGGRWNSFIPRFLLKLVGRGLN